MRLLFINCQEMIATSLIWLAHPLANYVQIFFSSFFPFIQPRVYDRKREGEYPTPHTAVQTRCG